MLPVKKIWIVLSLVLAGLMMAGCPSGDGDKSGAKPIADGGKEYSQEDAGVAQPKRRGADK